MKIRFAVAPGAGAADRDELDAFVDAVEAAGFDGIWLSDLPLSPLVDPLVGLALAAARTSRLHLGANIVPLGRNPFLLAKALAQLDRLSGGRVLLAFVPGRDDPGEREALGADGAHRGALLEEILALARAWWAGEVVDHRSERWSFHRVEPVVRPVQDPLEVWLGGRGPRALERVGRVADGWLGALVAPHEAAAARERIQASAARAGRVFDPEHFGMSIGYAREAPDPEMRARIDASRPGLDPAAVMPVGADALRATLHAYVDAGLSKFVLRPLGTPGPWDEEAAWLADAVLDLQT